MKKLFNNLLLLSGIVIMASGCASYMSLEASKTEIAGQKVVASGDQNAIKAFAIDGGAGIGVDVGNLQALKKHPFRQLGAAAVDAASVYGAYLGFEKLADTINNDSSDTTITINGDHNVINVKSDNNTTTITETKTEGNTE
jgi:hypothetical protein